MSIIIAGPLLIALYASVIYPFLVALMAHRRPGGRHRMKHQPQNRPAVSVLMVCFNEERHIAASLENLLSSTYDGPVQILVVSDASTDATETIVRDFASRGVQLLVAPSRMGKSAAENFGASHLDGEIVVHVDATSRPLPDAISQLVDAMSDPTVGVASGNDISVAGTAVGANEVLSWSESSYVGFEMRLRSWESRVLSIVGASGCFYAVRRDLFDPNLHPTDCRDFASVLDAYAAGYRSVSVATALCRVPRATSRKADFRRKVRTMSGGLITLVHRTAMLNPIRYGLFSWFLFSHKLCRWLVYPALTVSIAAFAIEYPGVFCLSNFSVAVAYAGLRMASRVNPFNVIAGPGRRALEFGVVASLAGVLAWPNLLIPRRVSYWEPTRR